MNPNSHKIMSITKMVTACQSLLSGIVLSRGAKENTQIILSNHQNDHGEIMMRKIVRSSPIFRLSFPYKPTPKWTEDKWGNYRILEAGIP
jgi:hypothetical protein